MSDPAVPAVLLAMDGVQKRYSAFRPALTDIRLTVARGELVVLHGPGESGKSVLLRLLAGLEAPSAGAIRVAGEDLARMRPRALAHLRRSMGILPPGDGLLPERDVTSNVALAARVAGIAREEAERRARAALDLVGIDIGRHGRVACHQLAAGTRHCVALARALVNRPAALLLDDLLDALDGLARERVLQVLDQFAAAGVAILAAVRSDGVPAGSWPARTRMVALRDGGIVA